MDIQSARRYSIEEYRTLLEASDERLEFADGKILQWEAMAG